MKVHFTHSTLGTLAGLVWCILSLGQPPAYASQSEITDPQVSTIRFISPLPSQETKDWTIEVKLHYSGSQDLSLLKVTANDEDVSYIFRQSGCDASGCVAEARLRVGQELESGWNYLVATEGDESGAVNSARLKFESTAGSLGTVEDLTLPNSVHVEMTPARGIEVDYTPEDGSKPHFYPDTRTCGTPGNLTVVVLKRATLGWKNVKCFSDADNPGLQEFLRPLTESDLVLASVPPGRPLGKLNLSRIGGTDFTAQNAPAAAYSYSIIGYGQGSAGIATESYNLSASAAWPGINGSLTDVSPGEQPIFGLRENDPVGFAVVPDGSNAKILLGNASSFPTGSGGTPPGQQIPTGFVNTTYRSPALAGSGSGLWLLVLDRHSLALLKSQTFSSTTVSGTNTSQVPDLLQALQGLDNSKVAFLTVLAGSDPKSPAIAVPSIKGDTYYQLVSAIAGMGVSPWAFDRAMGNQKRMGYGTAVFSMVGMPNQFRTGNNTQWYSSSQDTIQGETGALAGTLVRDRANQYLPSNVFALSVASLGENPTTSDFLAHSMSQAITESPNVAWPLNDTPGHINAYAYLSNAMVTDDFYGGDKCLAAPVYCNNIRFYYTGSQAEGIARGVDPSDLPAPSEPVAREHEFDLSDWQDAVKQLKLERAYLGNVLAYERWFESVNDDAKSNVALTLTTSATRIATDLNAATGQPDSKIDATPLSITSDVLSVISGISGAIGTVYKPAAVISGILAGSNKVLDIVMDANKTKVAPDPYVTQLGDLLGEGAGRASTAATKFNLNLELSTATFFNGVYSDWFKLQTIGLMSVNPEAPAWYVGKKTASMATGVGPSMVAGARRSFYMQTLNQYFVVSLVSDTNAAMVPSSKYPTIEKLNEAAASAAGLKYSSLPAYSWTAFTQVYSQFVPSIPYDNNYWTYYFIVLKANNKSTWRGDLGSTLMGASNDPTGMGNLAIPAPLIVNPGTMSFGPHAIGPH